MKRKDLHKIAPILAGLQGKNPFLTPKNYFQAIEDRVISKLTSENLSKTKKNFTVPEDYFQSVEDVVVARLKAETLKKENSNDIPNDYFSKIEDSVFEKISSTRKVLSLKRTVLKIGIPLSIAASLLWGFLLLNKPNKEVTFDNLATSEIDNYFTNGLAEIDAVSLAAAYPNIEITTIDFINDIPNETVEEYLDSENIEELLLSLETLD